VVFHEFAHQLDDESGANGGAPVLPNRSTYIAWARVLGEEYQDLLDHLKCHHKSDIDFYGATNPAEIFCCSYRILFEKANPNSKSGIRNYMSNSKTFISWILKQLCLKDDKDSNEKRKFMNINIYRLVKFLEFQFI